MPLLILLTSTTTPSMGGPFTIRTYCSPVSSCFDAYSVVIGPSGKIYSFDILNPKNLKAGVVPLAKNVPGLATPYEGTLYSSDSLGSCAKGDSTIITGLVPCGAAPTIQNAIPGYLWQSVVTVR